MNFRQALSDWERVSPKYSHSMRYIFIAKLNGGIGDYICLTAFINHMKKTGFPGKLVIITDKVDIYENNPDVNYIFHIKKNIIKRVVRFLMPLLRLFGINIQNYETFGGGHNPLESLSNNRYKKHYMLLMGEHFWKSYPLEVKCKIKLTKKEESLFRHKYKNKEYYVIFASAKTSHTKNKSVDTEILQKVINATLNREWLLLGTKADFLLDNVTDLRGFTKGIREVYYLISKAKLVLSTEGVANHIASISSTPSIVIYTGYSSKSHFSYQFSYSIVSEELPSCAPCYKSELCSVNYLCKSDNYVDQILNTMSKINDS
jgi:hypothetical protein